MLFDFDHIPFSRKGRFLTLCRMQVPGAPAERAVYVRSVRGGDERPSLGRLCRVDILDNDGNPLPVSFSIEPDQLIATDGKAEVRFVIGARETLHVLGRNAHLRFSLEGSRYDYVYRTPDGDACLVAAVENLKFIPRANRGEIKVTGAWQRDHADNVSVTFSGDEGSLFEGSIDFFEAVKPEVDPEGFDQARASARADFERWLLRIPAVHQPGEEARRLASYLLWANEVPAGGRLTCPAIYMSKNHMINIWSWDNAFSALGVAAADEQLAFDQFAAIFDHQHPSGLLPDYVNDRDVLFAFTKPPVHGWAVRLIAERHPGFLTPERKAYLRDAIALQVNYWLTRARADGAALPGYFHGNDSGWDNASFFAEGGPVLSPDLPVFLILACRCLSDVLEEDASRAEGWRNVADDLQSLLMDALWTGERFAPRLASDPGRPLEGRSLVEFMPLLLGRHLPEGIADILVARLLDGGFITPWGLATESPRSAFYEDDGYWRGPIWAPTTYLVYEGLKAAGKTELAADIARRFCALAEKSGMAENFDARTGEGLRDRAFAWTSAVYLLMAGDLRHSNI